MMSTRTFDEAKAMAKSLREGLQKKSMSQFKVTYFDMLFTRTKTLYKPGREGTGSSMGWFSEQPAQENIVWSDLDNDKSISQKKVFEESFLVQDSIRKIRWKLTDETRTIAGFSCRRANAIIMDSIYVVAFYTDEILAESGPESFTGLPGMILGVSLPHNHVSWFATKVEAVNVPDPFVSPDALVLACDWVKRLLCNIHPYLFTPDLRPEQDDARVEAFLNATDAPPPSVPMLNGNQTENPLA